MVSNKYFSDFFLKINITVVSFSQQVDHSDSSKTLLCQVYKGEENFDPFNSVFSDYCESTEDAMHELV